MPKRGSYKDISSHRFGSLIALRHLGNTKHGALWECRCDCGQHTEALISTLQSEDKVRCPSCKAKASRNLLTTHGRSKTVEHRTWLHIKSRCNNPRNKRFQYYGGRGIKICDRWNGLDGFANFFADVGPRPGPRYSIDRIDVNGHYEPGNVRWALPKTQGENKRTTRWFTIGGETKNLSDWCRDYNIHQAVVSWRINHGWDLIKALTVRPAISQCKLVHNGQTFTIAKWSRLTGISRTIIYSRIHHYGWEVERALTTPARSTSKSATPRRQLITINGEARTIFGWIKKNKLKATTIYMRIRRGWSPERAITGNVK